MIRQEINCEASTIAFDGARNVYGIIERFVGCSKITLLIGYQIRLVRRLTRLYLIQINPYYASVTGIALVRRHRLLDSARGQCFSELTWQALTSKINTARQSDCRRSKRSVLCVFSIFRAPVPFLDAKDTFRIVVCVYANIERTYT